MNENVKDFLKFLEDEKIEKDEKIKMLKCCEFYHKFLWVCISQYIKSCETKEECFEVVEKFDNMSSKEIYNLTLEVVSECFKCNK